MKEGGDGLDGRGVEKSQRDYKPTKEGHAASDERKQGGSNRRMIETRKRINMGKGEQKREVWFERKKGRMVWMQRGRDGRKEEGMTSTKDKLTRRSSSSPRTTVDSSTCHCSRCSHERERSLIPKHKEHRQHFLESLQDGGVPGALTCAVDDTQ